MEWTDSGFDLEHAASNEDQASEARASREAFTKLSPDEQRALIAFLENLVLFKLEEEEEPGATSALTQLAGGTQSRVKIAPKGFRIRPPQ